MYTSTMMYNNNYTKGEEDIDDIHLQNVLSYFKGLNEPPSDFFKHQTWILYVYLGICVHGFIMNAFLVMLPIAHSIL